jgi:hypothetical protein
MYKFGLLLVLATSLTFAQGTAQPAHPAPAPAKSPCVSVLQPQMRADTTAALQLKASAYTAGMEKGTALGAGGMLLLVGLALQIRKIKQADKSRQKPLARAASA